MENQVIVIEARISSKTSKKYLCAVYVPTNKIICFGDENIHNIFGVKWSVLEQIAEEAFEGSKVGYLYTIV